MQKKQWLIILGLILSISACKKDPETNNTPGPNTTVNGVLVTCEGTNDASSGLSLYLPDSNKSYIEVYAAANGGIKTGKFTQSMYVNNDKLYIVCNGNGVIKVANKANFKETGRITGFTSPRYFLPVSSTKAYVSDWYVDNSIAVVDLNTNTITKNININGHGTEHMALAAGKVFAANIGLYNSNTFSFQNDSTVSVIDANTDTLITNINIGYQVSDVVLDGNGKIWVLSNGYTDYGDINKDTKGILARINPNTLAIEFKQTVGAQGDHPSKLCISADGQTLFYQNGSFYSQTGGVYKMSIRDNVLPSTPFITRAFYGMNIAPSGDFYGAAAASDFVSNGYMLRYNAQGVRVGDTIKVGVTPGNVYFVK